MTLRERVRSAVGPIRGAGSRRAGPEPVFEVAGELILGDGVLFCGGPIQTQVAVTPTGVCRLGDQVFIGHGSSISCDRSVTVGPRTRLGAFAVIYDSDFHTAGSHDLRDNEEESAAPPAKTGPVQIGSDVRIGECVTILRGTTIGDGAIIDPGSVLWGSIPAGARVSGRPERTKK